jgi:hypothetical protein
LVEKKISTKPEKNDVKNYQIAKKIDKSPITVFASPQENNRLK